MGDLWGTFGIFVEYLWDTRFNTFWMLCGSFLNTFVILFEFTFDVFLSFLDTSHFFQFFCQFLFFNTASSRFFPFLPISYSLSFAFLFIAYKYIVPAMPGVKFDSCYHRLLCKVDENLSNIWTSSFADTSWKIYETLISIFSVPQQSVCQAIFLTSQGIHSPCAKLWLGKHVILLPNFFFKKVSHTGDKESLDQCG